MTEEAESPVPSPAESRRTRKNYYLFVSFNSLSFQILAGNILILYVIRIGAGNSFLGFLSSFLYLSFFFMFAGRILVSRLGTVRIYGAFILARNLAMVPMLLGPIFVVRGQMQVALALAAASAAAFNVARGIAAVCDNPVLADMAGGKDRGSFLSRMQFIAQAMAIISSLLMALFLGSEAPLPRYILILAAGISLGIAGTFFVFKLPEPSRAADNSSESLLSSVAEALSSRHSLRFFASIFLVYVIIALCSSFMLVYFKAVYGLPDAHLVLLAGLANVGALVMAIMSGFTLDRLGSKPLYFAFTLGTILSLVPIAVSPEIHNPGLLNAFCGLVFFLFGMGTAGMINAALAYFFGMTPTKNSLNYGMLFYLLLGAGGTLGSLAGGQVLDSLLANPALQGAWAFRLFYSISIVLLIGMAVIIHGLPNASAHPMRSALLSILSLRDLKALTLLKKLDGSRTVKEESEVLKELRDAPSGLMAGDIVRKLESPSFRVRSRALAVLEVAPLDPGARSALMTELERHPHTTGQFAARIMGKRGITEGIPELRKAMRSEDSLLAWTAMISLATLGDLGSLPEIEKLVLETQDAGLVMHGIRALELFGRASSVPVLLEKLRRPPDPAVGDEVILAMASMIGISDWFYPRFSGFIEERGLGAAELRDHVEERAKTLRPGLAALLLLIAKAPLGDVPGFPQTIGSTLSETPLLINGMDIAPLLIEALRDPELLCQERFRFFCSAAVIACA